jgi:hypothetical protein
VYASILLVHSYFFGSIIIVFFFFWALPPTTTPQKIDTIFWGVVVGGRALRGYAFASVLRSAAHSSLRRSPTIPNAVVLAYIIPQSKKRPANVSYQKHDCINTTLFYYYTYIILRLHAIGKGIGYCKHSMAHRTPN